MSLSQEKAQELQLEAAKTIQRAWAGYLSRTIFRFLKGIINLCKNQDPQKTLRTVNPLEAKVLDAAAGVFIKFRLGGFTFPPNIYYKIFTYRPIVDLCATLPMDYTAFRNKKPQEEEFWYQRVEYNSWRLFTGKVVSMDKPAEIGLDKKIDYHFSKLQRKQDVIRWKKRRKIEWLKKMYNKDCLEANLEDRNMVTTVDYSVQKVIDLTEEDIDDEILEWELDELLAWTNTLNFEEYIDDWRQLACTYSSESKTHHLGQRTLESHELADKSRRES